MGRPARHAVETRALELKYMRMPCCACLIMSNFMSSLYYEPPRLATVQLHFHVGGFKLVSSGQHVQEQICRSQANQDVPSSQDRKQGQQLLHFASIADAPSLKREFFVASEKLCQNSCICCINWCNRSHASHMTQSQDAVRRGTSKINMQVQRTWVLGWASPLYAGNASHTFST